MWRREVGTADIAGIRHTLLALINNLVADKRAALGAHHPMLPTRFPGMIVL
jgi:hypothetical protein